MYRRWSVLIMSGAAALLTFAQSAPAAALERAEPRTRADHLAAELRRDPVYVTDHTPRVLPPDTAERIKASVARLGVPTYVAVTPTSGLGETNPAQSLVPLLRDRLRRDGVYLVIPPGIGSGEARQFGGGRRLPVEDAWRATQRELPSDATAPEQVERFVEVALSGRARERAERLGPRPKSELRKALDADNAADRRAENAESRVFRGSAALSAVLVLAGLILYRVRKERSKYEPKRNGTKKQNNKTHYAKTQSKSKNKAQNKKRNKKTPTKGRR